MAEETKEQEVETTEAEQTVEVKEAAVEEEPKKKATRSKQNSENGAENTGADKVSANSEKDGSDSLERSRRAQRVGIVSSDKMEKTVVVRVDRQIKHPKYRRYVRRTSKFMAHDELGAGIGDKVRIMETRPLSRLKRWRVVEVIQKAAR